MRIDELNGSFLSKMFDRNKTVPMEKPYHLYSKRKPSELSHSVWYFYADGKSYPRNEYRVVVNDELSYYLVYKNKHVAPHDKIDDTKLFASKSKDKLEQFLDKLGISLENTILPALPGKVSKVIDGK